MIDAAQVALGDSSAFDARELLKSHFQLWLWSFSWNFFGRGWRWNIRYEAGIRARWQVHKCEWDFVWKRTSGVGTVVEELIKLSRSRNVLFTGWSDFQVKFLFRFYGVLEAALGLMRSSASEGFFGVVEVILVCVKWVKSKLKTFLSWTDFQAIEKVPGAIWIQQKWKFKWSFNIEILKLSFEILNEFHYDYYYSEFIYS